MRLLANRPQAIEQVLRERRCLGIFLSIMLLIVSVLPAFDIAYRAGHIRKDSFPHKRIGCLVGSSALRKTDLLLGRVRKK